MTNPAAPRLELRQSQSQSLVMTQALQQSIKLLQMTALEAQAFVEEQLESNPFLMEEEREADSGPPPGEEDRRAEEGSAEEALMPEDWRAEAGFADGSQLRLHVTVRANDGDDDSLHDTSEHEVSLREHLAHQLAIQAPDEVMRRLGMHLVDLIDDAGYIREDFSALAEQLGTHVGELERALAMVQSLDPSGVGARNLAECLGLQLAEQDRLDPAMKAFLENLHLLAEGNIGALTRKCGVDEEDVRAMAAEIRALDPKPGLRFHRDIVQPVAPDVTVRRDNQGRWHVELNASALPRVLVNRRYYAKIAPGTKGVDKKFVTERLQEANWLVKALDQRAHTILKVSTAIVGAQENFFRMGIHHLRPLTLKDIARETGFHESTVSRVTSGKYCISPRGTFELKYFFTSGLSHKAGGEDVSSQTVKHIIKELIEKEASPLSDDDIAVLLKEKNIDVARRTVAKYREALHIPSSMHRRRRRAV